jgi:hypothetical protein
MNFRKAREILLVTGKRDDAVKFFLIDNKLTFLYIATVEKQVIVRVRYET